MSTDAPELEQLLTIEELARAMRLHPDRVRALVKDKSNPLQEAKVGRYVRVLASSYRAYLESLVAEARTP